MSSRTDRFSKLSYPTDRHSIINESLKPRATARTLWGIPSDIEIVDNSPHNYLQLIPPALLPSNILPTYDLPDSPKAEKREKSLQAKANALSQSNNLIDILETWIVDAAAFGISYLVIYGDRVLHILHDQLEYEGNRLDPSKVTITYKVTPEVADIVDADQTDLDLKDCWDMNTRRMTRTIGDEVKETHKFDVLPVVALTFGNNPSDPFPYGLIYPWIADLAELVYYKNMLAINAFDSINQPTFIDGNYLAQSDKGIEYDFYGQRVIAVEDTFFHVGGAKVYKFPVTPLPAEYYRHIAELEKRVQENSHISDLLMARQLRSNVTAAEVQAIQQAQSTWISSLRERVRRSLVQFWKTWAILNDLPDDITIVIPEVDPTSPQDKLAKAQFLLSLLQTPIGESLDKSKTITEITRLLGIQSLVPEETPEAKTPATPQQNTLLSNLEQIVGKRAPEVLAVLQQEGLAQQAEALPIAELEVFLNQLASRQ